jgi:uncharacterized protein involved in exopolysaccharide biosynthesis
MDSTHRPIDILFRGLQRYWLSALLLFLLLFGGAVAALLRMQPLYEARALVVIGSRDLDASEGPRQGATELVTTMAVIAESEEVLRGAVERVGVAAFPVAATSDRRSLFLRARHLLYPDLEQPNVRLSDVEAVVTQVANRTKVRAQPLSNVLTLTYRDTDPAFAATFVNALAQVFVDQQLEVFSRSGATEFFAQQMQRFDAELQARFTDYQQFASQSGLHAVEEQRQLLLRRVFEASTAVSQTRSVILDKQGQRQAITAQLRRLAPVARSPYVSSLVTAFGDNGEAQAGRPQERGVPEDRVSDPPLLLVRAYQESIMALFRTNAELVGLERVEQEQINELRRVQSELARLVDREPEFEAHRRAIQTAIRNKEAFETRMIQERVLDEARSAKFSAVKLFQRAVPGHSPVFPQYKVLMPMAAALSLGFVLLVAYLRYALFLRRAGAKVLQASNTNRVQVSVVEHAEPVRRAG